MSIGKIISQLNAQGEPRNAIDPFFASLPQNILSGAVARQEQAFAEQVEEERRVAQDLHEREVAEAAAEYANSLYAKTERWREGPVPSAEELGVDVTDLAPARSELARFAAWVGQTRDQVRDLEAAREKFLTDLGAPAITEKALADLIAEDKSGFLAWLKSGADQKSKPNVDAFRRQQIEAKLAEDTYAAPICRACSRHKAATGIA